MKDSLLLWAPRIAGLAVGAFLSIFALDAFSGDRAFLSALPDFLLHLTPTFALLGVVYIAWRRPWVGALAFLGLAAVYVLTTLDHPNWIAPIAGPLALAGLLYVASWLWLRAHPRP